MKKILCFILSFLTLLSLISCGGEPPGARVLLENFADSYGASGIIFSPEISEGEAGYVDGDFFETIFGADADFESDYAVLLSDSVDSVCEAAVFVTRDDSSRMLAERLCRERLELISKMGYGKDSLLIRRGGVIFYSTLPDAALAERIWLDIKL